MLPAIRSRFAAAGLTKELRHSLAETKERWTITADKDGNTALTRRDMRIVLVARALRLLDAVHLYRDDAEIWLPLVSRLRLRAAARLRLIQFAKQDKLKVARTPGSPRASRRKRRAGAA